jgi:hypothetical protein
MGVVESTLQVHRDERSERLKQETLFTLSPVGVGLLIDEYPSSESDARTNDELLWAEGGSSRSFGSFGSGPPRCVTHLAGSAPAKP